MSKFNIATARPTPTSPITSEPAPSGTTFEGGDGYTRGTKSELFLLAVTNLVGEPTFYEPADDRDSRFVQLVHAATLDDPDWTARFLRWLRTDGHMRSAAIVGAAEFAKARRNAGLDGLSRQVIDSVLQRADEPGELLAYWTTRHGRAIPRPVKRGVGDAVKRLYTQRSLLKWDSTGSLVRFEDVLNLTHPSADTEEQAELYLYLLGSRHGRRSTDELPALGMLRRNAEVRERAAVAPDILLQPDTLRAAGFTWEAALSLAGSRVPKKDLWEALIPSMGYMALLRNLRNFDEAGVSDAFAEHVCARLANSVEVARSKQLPMRFLSAYRAAPSLRWAWALERALALSLANVPDISGRTLILIDTSGSMDSTFSTDGSLKRWDAAAVFGLALGLRCHDADIVSFSNGYWGGPGSMTFDQRAGESLLSALGRWKDGGFFIGGGTDTVGAVARHLNASHDRIVILTDEQHSTGNVATAIPPRIPLYTWNLAGYQRGHAPSGGGNRHTFGGLTDAAFRMIPLLEAGRNAAWPF